jgi:RecB family exonuclease
MSDDLKAYKAVLARMSDALEHNDPAAAVRLARDENHYAKAGELGIEKEVKDFTLMGHTRTIRVRTQVSKDAFHEFCETNNNRRKLKVIARAVFDKETGQNREPEQITKALEGEWEAIDNE